MDGLYERIEQLCGERGINITQMCKEAGVPRSTLSDYKANRIKSIATDKLAKIADYFDVSVDYLLGKEKFYNETEDSDPLSQVSFALFGTHDKIDEDILSDVREFARFKLEQKRKAAEEKK